MEKNLPIYQIQIDELEDMIVDVVSIVEHPATDTNFLAFSNTKIKGKINKPKTNFQFSSDEKMQLLGVAMIPDLPIYRIEEDEEFYVIWTKEEIENIVKVFMKNGLTRSMNVEHDAKQNANSFIFQSFIVDDKIKAPEILGAVPLGSWVIGVQVEDKKLWEDIKAGKRNGFSIEGLFKMLLTKKVIKKEFNEITNIDISTPDIDKKNYKIYQNWFNYYQKNK